MALRILESSVTLSAYLPFMYAENNIFLLRKISALYNCIILTTDGSYKVGVFKDKLVGAYYNTNIFVLDSIGHQGFCNISAAINVSEPRYILEPGVLI